MRLRRLILFIASTLTAANKLREEYNAVGLTNINDPPPAKHVKVVAVALPPPPNPRPLPPPPPSRPSPQPASDDLWLKCSNKGCALNAAMQGTDQEAGAAYVPPRGSAGSPYRSQDDLRKWFWSSFPPDHIDEKFHDFYNTWGIGWALQDLGISQYTTDFEGGKNEIFFIDHESFHPKAPNVDEQVYVVDGKVYRATGASYAFTINNEEGVIMGLNRKSPRYAADERDPVVPVDQLPALSSFSDISWIGWDSVNRRDKTDMKNLRYFISVGINNEETKATILRALNGQDLELEGWPGHVFEQGSAEFTALLGTPNLLGFAYFLIQHKDRLGDMFVSKIQVFHGDTRHKNPCIVMHVSQAIPKMKRGNTGVVRTHQLHAML